jgi:uncharacterized membrane protein YccF (DUF307 family)
MSSSTWFAESATECTPSASIDADPVIAAATNFDSPIARFAPNAVMTARVLLPSLAMKRRFHRDDRCNHQFPGTASCPGTAFSIRTVAHRGHAEGVRLILNVLWFVFGSGLVLAVGYGVAALICFALIVTIPFGIASLRLAAYSLWPFGRTIVSRPDAGIASGLANIVWVVLAGWWLALTHILAGVAQCVTIIGIPFGIANFKLVPAAFWPLGRRIVDLNQPETSTHL